MPLGVRRKHRRLGHCDMRSLMLDIHERARLVANTRFR